MSVPPRTISSPYMNWAKTRSGANFNLCLERDAQPDLR